MGEAKGLPNANNLPGDRLEEDEVGIVHAADASVDRIVERLQVAVIRHAFRNNNVNNTFLNIAFHISYFPSSPLLLLCMPLR